LYLNSEKRFNQHDNPLNTIARKKIWLFVGIQAFGVVCTVAISQTIAAIGFPVLIIALIPLRTFLMPKWFTDHELSTLDALTATNPAVLVSFGGTPAGMKKEKEEEELSGMNGGESLGMQGNGSNSSRERITVRQQAGDMRR
jgi:hypothetical protein